MSKRWDAMIVKEVNSKNYWTKIGAMFENRSGNGFSLVLDAIPPTTDGAYRISLFEPKENNSGGGSYSNDRPASNDGGNSNGRPGANRGQEQNIPEEEIPF